HRQSKEIARQLGISGETVDKHISNACRKLGVATRREAARMLLTAEGRAGLPVEPPYGSSGISRPGPARHAANRSERGVEAGLDRRGNSPGDRSRRAAAPRDRTIRETDAGEWAGGGADAALHLGPGGATDGGPGRA